MNTSHRIFFQLHREPFIADISHKEILVTPDIKGVEDRISYAVSLGSVALITGEIGSGKSTALRYVSGKFHPSEYRIIHVTASNGSILELYRNILGELDLDPVGSSRTRMTRQIKQQVIDTVIGKKMKMILIIDEASLLRVDVFSELHTLTQFDNDSKPFLPIILAGQGNLVDNLKYRYSMPLASRVVARCHLQGVDQQGMKDYLLHHLSIAGKHEDVFEPAAITAIHQGSGGLFRKANHLARGSIIVAAQAKSPLVLAEHVRIAATEIF
ncbi:MAG: AAA family ATPase [Desulfobacterium sp.]|jgi:type II secretory pathway predicted ATPase ExeA|nr:AAA family ATPase [Desulfobacterium sp.]